MINEGLRGSDGEEEESREGAGGGGEEEEEGSQVQQLRYQDCYSHEDLVLVTLNNRQLVIIL